MEGGLSPSVLECPAGGALLCSPLEFLDEFGGSCTSCIGSRFIQWGPLVQDNCSELDFTADEFRINMIC